ncbi:V-type ATP synthase subunit E [Halospeciosus flavus]|uniref:A-type ATP synthase subunit E n=1 Tax=Halospeciosus flavus TaxID=3032283 RepID=A0ABD5Z7V2_9EURY|nr:V-type ATP synthase subunit E [Halospeciosus flavus]
MSLETVVEEIRDEARSQAEEIHEEAEQEADRIVEEAEQEADEIIQEAEREVEREISQEREQKLSSAKLEAKHERMEARREAIAQAREQVEERIADLSGDERRELTRELLEDALAEFDEGEELAVHYAPGDEDLIEDLLSDYDGVHVAGEYDCLGGVVVESEESRVRVKNTFDSVLDDVWEDELKQISNRLFDEGDEEE